MDYCVDSDDLVSGFTASRNIDVHREIKIRIVSFGLNVSIFMNKWFGD